MWLLLLPVLAGVIQPEAPGPQSGTAPVAQSAELKNLIVRQEWERDWNGGLASAGLASRDTALQKLAVRAMGRMQKAEARDLILPMMRSPSAGVRAEAANALAQAGGDVDFASLLKTETDASVRGVLLESMGRMKTPRDGTEQLLVSGLADNAPSAREGAAKGLEALVRLRGRNGRPSPATVTAARRAFAANGGSTIRQLLLLTLNAAADQDSTTLALALRDTSAQVRRLAVLGVRRWVDDGSPLVRYQGLRADNSCERAVKALSDGSEMVSLAAIDMVGDRKCPGTQLLSLVTRGNNWRARAHALVALAKTAPDSARRHLPAFAQAPLWHERVYAATAARIISDSATLRQLARDTQPNVAAEALVTTADAVRALSANHAGLLLAAANKLKGAPELPSLRSQLQAAMQRPGVMQQASSADARAALGQRLREIDSTFRAGPEPSAVPLPTPAEIERNRGATAQITLKGLGVITLELLVDEAPLTVHTFAMLADSGKYNGLTFHRIVPNFVIQGGSPGADEYDGLTRQYMRDEVGRVSHLRGTLGISTRGYDKGDGQIFINLVDNFRLDHAYTVFARVTSGMDVVDKVQEGDVMETVRIMRKR